MYQETIITIETLRQTNNYKYQQLLNQKKFQQTSDKTKVTIFPFFRDSAAFAVFVPKKLWHRKGRSFVPLFMLRPFPSRFLENNEMQLTISGNNAPLLRDKLTDISLSKLDVLQMTSFAQQQGIASQLTCL
jgi:hypothetical protein